MIDKAQILQGFQNIITVIAENKDYLTELDAAIGDGDHGINLNRGWQKVQTQLPTLTNQDIGSIFKAVSMTLISSVGGASGPLYGTMFLRASMATTGKSELNQSDLVKVFQAFVEGIVTRGKATVGDKTMLDTLQPAADAVEAAMISGNSLSEILQQAIIAAEEGMNQTYSLVAKKGRASYLGERSKDHLDPGAVSTYLILKALFQDIT
ncbi:MAG: dihydroxyacetone kinase subunit DhaL [Microcoleaceae cyanobacterium]